MNMGLIFLKYKRLAEFSGIMAVSLLAILHRHCLPILRCHLIETDHNKRISKVITRTGGFSMCLDTEDPFHYFGLCDRFMLIYVITTSGDYCIACT
ncbi:hypothetical protein AVEN_260595-1 [Araneus ventricosus]|uniref:Uncharacterized protein n=1 Tax=Araneus ventricosus TaxID=182803 RepID=A0A4Y2IJ00_ARAVE|nr:hypothetical protein AVEN_260595-1 [Araneus ventricosus]